jgi:hypothetical protein
VDSLSLSSIAALELDRAALANQAVEFRDSVPEPLKYSGDNLHQHDTQGIGNQFILFHIVMHMNLLLLSKFAVASPFSRARGVGSKPSDEEARTTAVKSAIRISELFKDGEGYRLTAPFLGYCAFVSSTVLIFTLFSPEQVVPVFLQDSLKENLVTNTDFLNKMKRYWGVFGHMAHSIRDILQACVKTVGQAQPISGNVPNTDQLSYDRSSGDDNIHTAFSADFFDTVNDVEQEVPNISWVEPYDLVPDGGFFHQVSIMNVAAPVLDYHTNASDIFSNQINWGNASSLNFDDIAAFDTELGSEDLRFDWVA